MAAKPQPRRLRPGDSVTIDIQKIGRLTNYVARETV
jgi:2-keto-4-pentenoate hydratase/2-oxohepta-3-ene-1,7-dioic acid hydratase in catechol pathway